MRTRDDKLLEFATDRQKQVLEAIWQTGSLRGAARQLGIVPSAVHKARRAVLARAAMQGYAPDHDMTHPAPEPFAVKGTSTLYAEDGTQRLQWVKTHQDVDKRRQALEAIAEALAETVPPAPRIDPPWQSQAHLCALYTITDAHLGMLAWGRETGADWDLDIAQDTILRCFDALVQGAPDAETAIVNQLGDFLHSDGLVPITPTSGHILDQDSRFSKVVAVAVKTLRLLIDRALQKHKAVHVIIAEGNHDLATSAIFRTMFAALYENNDRVTINASEAPYYTYVHGDTFLGFHHGHMVKRIDDLPLIFATQHGARFGAAAHRYIHTGHRHHTHVKDVSGVWITQHPTLAARDAHSARHGLQAQRRAACDVYDATHGHVASRYVAPGMVASPTNAPRNVMDAPSE